MYKDQHKWIRLALIGWDSIISLCSFLLAGILRFHRFSVFFHQTDSKELFIATLLMGVGLPPIVVPKRELGNADFRHENLCYCLAVS